MHEALDALWPKLRRILQPMDRGSSAVLRAEYRELNANMRVYGGQRFQHLSLYSAAMAGLVFLAVEAERANADSKFVPGGFQYALGTVIVLGLLLSAYFVFMERRASDYWNLFRDRARRVEDTLHIGQWLESAPQTPELHVAGRRLLLNATTATIALGVTGGVAWPLFALWHVRDASATVFVISIFVAAVAGIWLVWSVAGMPVGPDRLLFAREPWLRAYESRVTLPNGRILDPFYTVRAPEYVIVVATTGDGRVVIEKAYKHATGGTSLDLPTGGIDGGESALRCASRELGDETGYVSQSDEDWREIGSFVVDGNHGFGKAHVMRVEHVSYDDGRRIHDANEPIEEVILLSPEDAYSALRDGRVRTLHTFAALSWFCGEHASAPPT